MIRTFTETRISVIALFLGFLLLGGQLSAQEKSTISRESLSDGIAVLLAGESLRSVEPFLVVEDSRQHQLALRGLTLNGQSLWLRTIAGNIETAEVIDGMVQWQYDKENGRLKIDLRGILAALSAGSRLELRLMPLNSRAGQYQMALYYAGTGALNTADSYQKIREIAVSVN